jgi:hypothetical protein
VPVTPARFTVGDRVRVTAAWTECLGNLGTIAQPDETIRNSRPGWQGDSRLEQNGSRSYWVEMDVTEWVPGVIEAGEFPEDALEPAGHDVGRDA